MTSEWLISSKKQRLRAYRFLSPRQAWRPSCGHFKIPHLRIRRSACFQSHRPLRELPFLSVVPSVISWRVESENGSCLPEDGGLGYRRSIYCHLGRHLCLESHRGPCPHRDMCRHLAQEASCSYHHSRSHRALPCGVTVKVQSSPGQLLPSNASPLQLPPSRAYLLVPPHEASCPDGRPPRHQGLKFANAPSHSL